MLAVGTTVVRALEDAALKFERELGGRAANRKDDALRSRAMEILDLLGLADQADETASSQPHGNQRHICLGVALAAEPTLAAPLPPAHPDWLTDHIPRTGPGPGGRATGAQPGSGRGQASAAEPRVGHS